MDNDTIGVLFFSGCALVFFGIPGFVGYRAAKERGRNRIIWTILSAFFPPVPIIILYMIRPAKVVPGKSIRCPYCQEIAFTKVGCCEVCGKELVLPKAHPLVSEEAKPITQN